jgi:hypothetical protein
MTPSSFFKIFISVSLVLAGVLFGVLSIDELKYATQFTWLSFGVLCLLTGSISYMGLNSIKTGSNQKFMGFFLSGIVFKLLLSISLIGGYYWIAAPENAYFVIPFMLIYLTYLIFETVFLSKASKQ